MALAFALGQVWACKASFESDCPAGNENCECSENDSCLEGLACLSNVCVSQGSDEGDATSESSGSEPSESSGETGGGTDCSGLDNDEFLVVDGSTCYGINATASTYDGGEEICVALGGHLASVTSTQEWVLVLSLLEFTGYPAADTVILGARSPVGGAPFVWSSGEAFGFDSWAPGQPNDPGQVCSVSYRGSEYNWHDEPCDTLHAFMCEWPAG